jgi:hypothetical protein
MTLTDKDWEKVRADAYAGGEIARDVLDAMRWDLLREQIEALNSVSSFQICELLADESRAARAKVQSA